jgi:hypothetical protein
MYLSHVKIRLPFISYIQTIWNRNNIRAHRFRFHFLSQNIEERKVIGLSTIAGFASQNKIKVMV